MTRLLSGVDVAVCEYSGRVLERSKLDTNKVVRTHH